MSDVEALYGALLRLDALDDAIAATSLQAKPAIRALLSQVHAVCVSVMKKGAHRGLKLGRLGAYSRKNIPADLVELLMLWDAEKHPSENEPDDVVRTDADGDRRALPEGETNLPTVTPV